MHRNTSIADASAIFYGMVRVMGQASGASGTPITLSQAFEATLRQNEQGARLQSAVTHVGAEAVADVPGSPPFRQSTARVVETRDGKLNAVRAIHVAALATAEHLESAFSGNDESAQGFLMDVYKVALRAIDTMRGREFDLCQTRSMLFTEVFQMADSEEGRGFAANLLEGAEKNYLDEEQSALFRTSKSAEHDFDMSP
ncbi:MAG: hypothetical protein LBE22_05850 [Azoarcus sp.]|jgi:hypothetical protein|nr:hypothetical protein [Azoarcus sp.]